jgi:lipoprotein-anchoring transpeptidase ErfK/SrfK
MRRVICLRSGGSVVQFTRRGGRTMLMRERFALILRGIAATALASRSESTIHPGSRVVFLALILFLTSCATKDTEHHIVVSARDQKLALLKKGNLIATYPISTSKFGLGDTRGSYRTPLGELEVANKIGGSAASGTVFKNRRRTGEVIPVDAPGRDPIVTRIIWLRGRERQNANAFARDIYIHGTPEERNIGRPASYGCIRMRSSDIINLYNVVGEGAEVTIVDAPLAAVVPSLTSASQMAEANHAGMVIR